jgi:hypothetical protein
MNPNTSGRAAAVMPQTAQPPQAAAVPITRARR